MKQIICLSLFMIFIFLSGCVSSQNKSTITEKSSKKTDPSSQTGSIDLIDAVLKCDLKKVEKIIKEKNDVDEKDNNGYNALHWASGARLGGSCDNKQEIVAVLCENIHNINTNVNTASGGTALHIASSAQPEDVITVETLLNMGADVNSITQNGDTPLHMAAYKGNERVAKALLNRGADINAINENGNTPLHFAVHKRKEYVVDMLLNKGANHEIKNKGGVKPVNIAELEIKEKLVALYRPKIEKKILSGEHRAIIKKVDLIMSGDFQCRYKDSYFALKENFLTYFVNLSRDKIVVPNNSNYDESVKKMLGSLLVSDVILKLLSVSDFVYRADNKVESIFFDVEIGYDRWMFLEGSRKDWDWFMNQKNNKPEWIRSVKVTIL